MAETTYSELRRNLAKHLDEVADDSETLVVHRRGKRDVALIAADELRNLIETVHVLTPPENGRRLLEALAQAERGEGISVSIEELHRIAASSPSSDGEALASGE